MNNYQIDVIIFLCLTILTLHVAVLLSENKTCLGDLVFYSFESVINSTSFYSFHSDVNQAKHAADEEISLIVAQ